MSLPLTYPSQSLRFLETLNRKDKLSNGIGRTATVPEILPARLKLDIVIVGAGLGGLALAIALARRGHAVQILEQAPQLGEVGAGIQIPPNSGRLLHRWGVFEHLEKWAVQPEAINFRRWEDGTVIGHTALGDAFEDNFETPYYVVHRAHFHEALHQRALQLGVVVKLGCKVVKYNEKQGSVMLDNGIMVRGDLVVAADGIKSVARDSMFPDEHHEPIFDGFAAYRATVDVKKMRNDPDIAWILERPALNIW
ncbi:hypothetical protein SLS60_010028 [Paraconiothyrium brasiliense]|uniref:FAD-binding domain-containing protein n=1 Tax=Paraconiothyrium brasiliense TaxID=300254 RepID=A0ABR3QT59_9PLEO